MRFFRQHLCLILALAALTIAQQACAGTDASPDVAARKTIALSGQVLESMDAGGYTYVQLKNGADKVWVAIPLMKVSVGQHLTLIPGYELKNVASKALNRKFDSIIFSAGLENKPVALSPSAIKMVHEGIPVTSAPAPAAAAPKPKPSQSTISMVRVTKAKGANAYTIAQLYSKKAKLEKKEIVVRGRVVKVTTRIMKRNWIHIQDGSGSEARKNNELVITTKDLPKEGDLVTARGTLYNNIDYGSGYKYNLIIQGAQLQ